METECGMVIEYLEHNKALEQSPNYQKIMQEVDKENVVHYLFGEHPELIYFNIKR